MGSDRCPVTDRSIVTDKDLICKHPVKHHLMTNINTFADVHTAPSVDDSSPALNKTKKGNFIQKKPPHKFHRIAHLPKETFVTVKVEYFLCRH